MKTFRIEFSARRRGAIGIWQVFVETVRAESLTDAVVKLYDNFDHIHIIAATEF